MKLHLLHGLSLIWGLSLTVGSEAKTCTLNKSMLGTKEFQVEVTKTGTTQDSSKSVIIIPPTGGTNYIDRSYARQLCKQGFDVYILNHWTDSDEYDLELEVHQRFYERGQKAIQIVLDQISSSFIGILGTSVGAEHAAVAASNFTQIDSVFTIVGGAPISKVIAESSQEILAKGRKARFSLMSFNSIDEYGKAISEVLTLEPFKMEKKFLNKDIGMILSSNDKVVPSKYQEELRNFWKPRTVVTLSNNHFYTVVKAWLCYSDTVIKHFKDGAKAKLSADLI